MIQLDDVKQIWSLTGNHLLSLYLRVDSGLSENQATNPAWRIFIKNALNDISNDIQHPDEQVRWDALSQRVKDYFSHYAPASKGLVMFLGPDTELIYELPVLPEDNVAHYGRPMVLPLLWILESYKPYLIVLIHNESARFMTSYLGSLERQGKMEYEGVGEFEEKTLMPHSSGLASDMGGVTTSGSHRDRVEAKRSEWFARFLREVAKEVQDWMVSDNSLSLILGGHEKTAHALKDHLSDQARARLVGMVPIPDVADDLDIMERILPLALAHERQQELDLVDKLISQAKTTGGAAVLGDTAIENALQMQQVDKLIMSWPPEDTEVFHRLSVKALQNNATVRMVHGDAAERLREAGGIGARLYYVVQSS